MVGGGTVGAWCAYFLRTAGLERVVLIEKGVLGQGASSRAAGVVRLQGGTPEAVRLGIWSRRFYLGQHAELGTDSGFVSQGYLLPCFTTAEVEAARQRLAMQSAFGIGAVWLDPDEVDAVNPALAPGQTLGGTFCADDGYISPPRNVAAYTVALLRSGVTVAERVAFRGLLAGGGQVHGVHDQRRRDSRAPRRAHRRPQAGAGGRPGRDPDPGRRGQAPGRGHRAAPRPAPVPGAHGLRPAAPGCTGGRKRAACCSG